MTSFITNFITKAMIRRNLEIPDGYTKDDERIEHIVAETNIQINLALKPYITELPVSGGDPNWNKIVVLGIHYAKMLWFRGIFNTEIEKLEFENYARTLEKLRQSFRVDRNPRTRTVLVSRDPRRRRLFLPCQKDAFILDSAFYD